MPRSNGQETFAQWPLKSEILSALSGMGFTRPTAIQHEAIPLLLQGEDVIGQAKTGTGKTAAFGIPILQHIKPNDPRVQALVLVPTRELAEQVAHEVGRMGKGLGVKAVAIIGGARFEGQVRELRKGAPFVVGTPGRVMDLMRRGLLDVGHVHFVVLDEADRMLDMGFIEDIQWILARCPPRDRRQTLFFSATIPEGVRELAHRFMREPVHVRGEVTERLTVDTIQQEYYDVGRRNKLWALTRIIDHEKPQLMIVFVATKRMADRLADDLQRLRYPADVLHGDLTQAKRQRVMEKFKRNEVHVLVATDVAARGLDIEGVSHVVNYDLPEDPEVYVHRIGRTGRMGRSGKAISFVSRMDRSQLDLVQRVAGGLIELKDPPGPAEGGPAREKVRKVIDWDHISDRYGNVHIRVEVGRKDGMTMTQLHKLIRGATRIDDYLVGGLKIHDEYSEFHVPKDYAMRTVQGLRSVSHEGKKVSAEIVAQA